MTKNELKLVLSEGEGYRIEFKENLSNIDREIVAFANSSGGKIFFGISDSGEMKGAEKGQKSSQKSSQKILEIMQANHSITIRELSQELHISDRAVKKNISKLKLAGKLHRIGPDKGGYWEILKK